MAKPPAQAEEEENPLQGSEDRHDRLQGHRAAAQVHLRPRQDPRPPGDRRHRPGAAQDRHRHQERARDGAAALHLDRPLRSDLTMKLILTQEVDGLGTPGDIVEVKDGYGRNYLLPRGLAIRLDQGRREADRRRSSGRARPARSATTTPPSRCRPGSRRQRCRSDGARRRHRPAVRRRDRRRRRRRDQGGRRPRGRQAQGPDRQPIKTVGSHTVTVRLHTDSLAKVTVEVVGS